MEHFLPWYHFTTVMWHFLPWYHFAISTLISFYYLDVAFSTLMSFDYRNGTFSSLISFYYRAVWHFLPWHHLLPWWNIFFVDIILLPWCDIFYLDFFNPDVRDARYVINRKGVKCVNTKTLHISRLNHRHSRCFVLLTGFFFFLKNTVKSIKNKK